MAVVTVMPGMVADWQAGKAGAFADTLAVFRLPLPALTENVTRLKPLLTPDELSRAGRFHQPIDRLRFVCGRGLLRTVVGRYTDQAPEQVQLGFGPTQKPMLANTPDLSINLAHAGRWVLLAVGRESVGVDVELVNDSFDYQPIVGVSFSRAEREFIGNQPDAAAARRAFYQFWTRKEALVKATALGLTDAARQIPALPGEHHVAASVLDDAGAWTVRGFEVDDAHPAALAHRPTDADPVFYTIDPDFIR
jgi:4'-phosphopantetheinyl transferase